MNFMIVGRLRGCLVGESLVCSLTVRQNEDLLANNPIVKHDACYHEDGVICQMRYAGQGVQGIHRHFIVLIPMQSSTCICADLYRQFLIACTPLYQIYQTMLMNRLTGLRSGYTLV